MGGCGPLEPALASVVSNVATGFRPWFSTPPAWHQPAIGVIIIRYGYSVPTRVRSTEYFVPRMPSPIAILLTWREATYAAGRSVDCCRMKYSVCPSHRTMPLPRTGDIPHSTPSYTKLYQTRDFSLSHNMSCCPAKEALQDDDQRGRILRMLRITLYLQSSSIISIY